MGQPITCRATRNISHSMPAEPPAGPPVCSSVSGTRESLYLSITHRQIRPRKVLQYPYSGEWTSDGVSSNSGRLVMENCGTPAPPLALSFTEKRWNGHCLAVADEDGYVNIFNTNRGLPAMISSQGEARDIPSVRWLAHTNAIFDICWIKEDTHMLTASGDQTVSRVEIAPPKKFIPFLSLLSYSPIKLWDVETQLEMGVMKGHSGSVKSLCVNPSQSDLFVSGSRDGCVSFWDIRNPAAVQNMPDEVSYGPVAKVKDAHKGFTAKFRRRQGYTRSVTAVLYLKDERVVATAGANDGIVKYWDTRKLKAPIARTPPEGLEASVERKNGNRLHGIAGLAQDPSGTRLIATCVDSKIYMYDVMQPKTGALKTFSGHVMGTFYIKAAFSPDGSHILSGSSDHNIYIWKVDEPENNPTVLEGHTQEVTAVAWCPTDFCKIATCSDDYTVRLWRMKEPRFAARPTRDALTSRPPIVGEPDAPMSPSAHLISSELQVEQDKSSRSDSKKFENNTAETTDTILGVNSHRTHVTPPSKKSRLFESPSVRKDLLEARKDEQESPQPKDVGSPSSVLSPPGSISRRRKTIVDYFGLQP